MMYNVQYSMSHIFTIMPEVCDVVPEVGIYVTHRPSFDHPLPQSQIVPVLANSRAHNLDFFHRPIIRLVRLDQTHPLHDPQPTLHASENGVLPVQPRTRRQRDEELTCEKPSAESLSPDQTENLLPFVFGPLFAMLNTPAPVCLSDGLISSSKASP